MNKKYLSLLVSFVIYSCGTIIEDTKSINKQDKIFFLSDRNTFKQLYTITPDGKDLKNITPNLININNFDVSKDGSKVIYLSFDEKNESDDIFSINSDGANVKNLTSSTTEEFLPKISPDGSKIIYLIKYRNEEESPFPEMHLYIMNSDGSEKRRLGNISFPIFPIFIDPNIDWSPDSSKIVFKMVSKIYIFDLERDNGYFLTKENNNNMFPSWSPDGKSIAFISEIENKSSEIVNNLHTINIDGTSLKNITNYNISLFNLGQPTGGIITVYNYGKPEWLQDSSEIIYTLCNQKECNIFQSDAYNLGFFNLTYSIGGSRHLGISPDGNSILYTKDGKSIGLLSSLKNKEQTYCNFCNVINSDFNIEQTNKISDVSKDNKNILYINRKALKENSYSENIFIMDNNGDNKKQLTDSINEKKEVKWSPDNSKISYIEDNNLYVLDNDGKNLQTLVNDIKYNYIWSPDSSKIAFIDKSYNINVINSDGTGLKKLTNEKFTFLKFSWDSDNKIIINYSIDDIRDVKLSEIDKILNSQPINSDRLNSLESKELKTRGNISKNLIPSPDKTMFAYKKEDHEIGIVTKDLTISKILSNDGVRIFEPIWSIDSKRIIYVEENYSNQDNKKLISINIDGTNKKIISYVNGLESIINSSDNKYAYLNMNKQIFRFDIETNEIKLLTKDFKYSNSSPLWR